MEIKDHTSETSGSSSNKKVKEIKRSFMDMKFNSKIILIALILLMVNFVFGRLFFRLDLTENSQYSLSSATIKILKKLDDRVNIEAYFSDGLPERVQNVRNQLRDLLEEFRARSSGSLQFKFVDPGKDPTTKQRLRMKGIQEVNLNVFEEDKSSVARVYMGMAIHYQDKHESIPVIERADDLEYQIITAIRKMSAKETLTLGYTSGRGERDIDKDLPPLARALRKQYDLKKVELSNGPVDENVKTLIVFGVREKYQDAEIYYLDQFIMRGGKVFFGLDQVTFGQQNKMGLMGKPIDTGLDPLLSHFGIKVEKNMVLDLRCAQAPFRTSFGTLVQHYPLWPKLIDFNKDVAMVNRIDSLVLQWASSVTPVKKKGIESKILVRSSDQSWQQQGFFNLDPQFASKPSPGSALKSFDMAILSQGSFESFFNNKPIPEGVENVEGRISKTENSRIIAVGDSEFIIYGLQARRQTGNINFFLNSIDFLTLGDDLIGIRTKKKLDRPLEPQVRQSDYLRSFLKALTIFLMPFGVIMIGVFRFIKRRNIRRLHESMYAKG